MEIFSVTHSTSLSEVIFSLLCLSLHFMGAFPQPSRATLLDLVALAPFLPSAPQQAGFSLSDTAPQHLSCEATTSGPHKPMHISSTLLFCADLSPEHRPGTAHNCLHQRPMYNQMQVCAACIPRKAHLEVPIGTESIILSTFILGLLNLKEHRT